MLGGEEEGEAEGEEVVGVEEHFGLFLFSFGVLVGEVKSDRGGEGVHTSIEWTVLRNSSSELGRT